MNTIVHSSDLDYIKEMRQQPLNTPGRSETALIRPLRIEEPVYKDARILIIDDEPTNVRLLEILLEQSEYTNIRSTTDSRQALSLYVEWQPDLILLDLMMPYLDGYAVMCQLRSQVPVDGYLPILVLTADVSSEARRRALAEGAKDFVTKPLDRVEVLLRIRNLLEARFRNLVLEQKVQERTQDLELAQVETLERLALAAEYRDDDTGLHTRRVGLTSARLAQGLGCPSHQVAWMERAAALHDIGKIGIPDAILLKPYKLTDEEFATMKTHTLIGAKILSGSSSAWLQLAEEIALTHHERWDGGGYAGLQGDSIPLAGRIVAVADVFDALTHERPYKNAWPVEQAVGEIQCQSGSQFDPCIVEVFLRFIRDRTL